MYNEPSYSLARDPGEQRRLLESIMGNANDAILVAEAEPIDAPGPRIVYANESFTRMTGYSAEEVIGQTPRLLQGENTDRARLDEIRRALSRWEPVRVEVLNYRKDGSEFWVELNIAPVTDESGRITHWVSIQRQTTERRLAEKALEESERRFRSVVQNSSEVVKITEADGTLRYASPAFERIFGYTPEEAIGTNVLDYVHPEDLPRIQEETERALQSSGVVGNAVEYRFRHADGSWRWVESVGTYLLEDPAVEGVVLNARDVTERKRDEQALQESEQRFRQLFEQSVDAVYIHDEKGRFVDCNAQACRLLGYTREELLSMAVEDVSLNILTPEERTRQERKGDTLWQLTLAAEPGVFSQSHEEEHIRKDGTIFPVEVSVGSVDYGGRRMLLASIRDVTERKRAEEELRLKDRAVESSSNGMIITDPNRPDNPIIYVNPTFERITGYTLEETVGRNCRFLRDSDEDQPRLGELRRAVEEGREWSGTLRNYRKSGETFWNELYIAPVHDEEGRLMNFIGIQKDVTQRKWDEQALRESEQRLKTVTASAPVILFAIDSKGIFTFESGAALEDLGLEPGANVGHSVFETYADFPRVLNNVRRALSGEGVTDTVEIAGRAYHATYSPQRNGDGKVYGIIGVATDVTERQRLERSLEHLATHDPLSGLANRRLLFTRIAHALECAEQRGEFICLLFVDLDGFKEVNDQYGHEVGDSLIAAVAGRIKGCLRPSDTAARVGGDEFCILLEEVPTSEEAIVVAERLAASFEAPFSLGTSTLEIGASIGIAVKGPDNGACSPDELVREADAAMYRAKARVTQYARWSQ